MRMVKQTKGYGFFREDHVEGTVTIEVVIKFRMKRPCDILSDVKHLYQVAGGSSENLILAIFQAKRLFCRTLPCIYAGQVDCACESMSKKALKQLHDSHSGKARVHRLLQFSEARTRQPSLALRCYDIGSHKLFTGPN